MQTAKVVFITILTALISSTVTFFGLRALTAKKSPFARQADVPLLLGMRPVEGRKLLEAKGLVLFIAEEREDLKIEAGRIIQQNPSEGSRSREGTEVRVTLSTGPAKVDVPVLARLPLTEAIQRLAAVGLRVGLVTRQAQSQLPADQVITQEPAGATSVAQGSKVSLIIAAGSDSGFVDAAVAQAGIPPPDGGAGPPSEDKETKGQRKNEGEAKGQGGSEKVAERPPAAHEEAVQRATPAKGGTRMAKTAYSLVPRVVGWRLGAAKKVVLRAGFIIGKITHVSDEDRRSGIVLRQNPAAKARAAKGSAVNLVVNETD